MPDCCGGVLLAWQIAAVEAAATGHISIEPEHLLIGLCKFDQALTPDQNDALEKYFGDVSHLYQEKDQIALWFSSRGIDRVKLRRSLRHILGPGPQQPGQPTAYMHRSAKCRRIFERAGEVAAATDGVVHGSHLLLAIINRPTQAICKAFAVQSSDLAEPADIESDVVVDETKPALQDMQPHPVKPDTPLAHFGTDLTALGRTGQIEPLIGRRQELLQIVRTLSRRSKNNPILLGDPGVGKTALVRGLALRIAEGKVPEPLKSVRIVELSMASLVAGTKYRGQFEERLTRIVQESKADPHLILFLDEIHTLVSAGSAEGAMDAANILKPALSKGDIRCIGATTIVEYRKYFERDAALARRFQPVSVAEPTIDEVESILKGVRQRYERHHQVTITDGALVAITKLSSRYLPNRFFPDKALDVLDESCTLAKFGSVSALSAHSASEPVVVTEEVVQRVVAEMAKVPLGQLADDLQARLAHLEDDLRQRVIGQDYAIGRVSHVLRLAAAGLRNPQRPQGVFLFLGPTGVGKTQLAKALAEVVFGSPTTMIRLDMSEYKEKHSVAKLIGAPPGYIGSDEEGQLTGKLRSNPHCLVLLDEIEKAHPDVFDLFLQLFDEGRLTDSKGRTVDSRHSLFVMTSNAAPNILARVPHQAMGFVAQLEAVTPETEDKDGERARLIDALGATFKPEFLNRIDEIVRFKELAQESLRAIACKMLDDLIARVEERDITVELSDNVAEFIYDKVSTKGEGARHMARLIEDLIGVPLGNVMLNNNLKAGDCLEVAVYDNRIAFLVGPEGDRLLVKPT